MAAAESLEVVERVCVDIDEREFLAVRRGEELPRKPAGRASEIV